MFILGDPTSSESSSGQPHGSERVDMVPPAFIKKGYKVHIHGGSAHFTTQDGSRCFVEMEDKKEFHIELSNNNDYSKSCENLSDIFNSWH